MALVTVSVSVPEGSVPELYKFAARLCEAGTGQIDDKSAEVDHGGPPRGMGKQHVIAAYTGGVSDHWRPMLKFLADRPDTWVLWQDICDHMELSVSEAAGMLGAAERRCGQHPPYEKRWIHSKREFRMPGHVAQVINQLPDPSE